VSKNASDQDTAFQQALQKGNRFFARKNFPLAKREFEAALCIEFDEALREKIRLCAEEMGRQERKEAVKRGRKLEKKGKYAQALQCFEQAAAQETETWLESKIAELRERLALSEASTLAAGAAASDDLEARLAAYDQALAINPTQELLQKKAESLVKLGRFDEAVALYCTQRPSGDRARYSFGYAYARTGRYLSALKQWSGIRHKGRRLLAQVETLLPFVCRELETEGEGYATSYGFLQAVPDTEKSPQLKNYQRYLKFKYMEELWSRGEYEEILALLSPDEQALSLPWLALYAKLYFHLAEREIRYLEPAISFWLTAVYNDQILESLHIKQLMGEGLDVGAIREKLLQSMEALVDEYARQGLLSDRLGALWKMEARIIRRVSTLSRSGCSLELFPCTPAFASQFSLAGQVLGFLEERRQASGDEREESIEVSAYFSEAGRSLMLMEQGEEDEALSSIPKDRGDELGTYCRRKVSLGYGMKKARAGEKQLKKYFLEALPLLEKYPRYADEITELVYAEEDVKSYIGLAAVMELLSAHIQTPSFREATAHAMGLKAIELLNSHVNPAVAEKLLNKALCIYPDSPLAQSTLADVRSRMGLDELTKAFKRQNLSKAAKVVNCDRDPRLIEYFFETMEAWFQTATEWDAGQKLSALQEFYESCSLVDRKHPLTMEIGAELRRLEGK
jgi:tetratricopeptide (TPR) repeat protein